MNVSIDEILDIANKRLKEESEKYNQNKTKEWNEGFNDGIAFALLKILEVKYDLEEVEE